MIGGLGLHVYLTNRFILRLSKGEGHLRSLVNDLVRGWSLNQLTIDNSVNPY